MNTVDRWYCRSDTWRYTVSERLLSWVLAGVDLGPDVLEVGPGPGLTTDVLAERVRHLTCVEVDPAPAASLAGPQLEVIEADAIDLPFAAGRFSGAVSCTMLHHVPSPELQDRLLAEVARVLAPGRVAGRVGQPGELAIPARALGRHDGAGGFRFVRSPARARGVSRGARRSRRAHIPFPRAARADYRSGALLAFANL
jgi:SAM-dependent methyltransferase